VDVVHHDRGGKIRVAEYFHVRAFRFCNVGLIVIAGESGLSHLEAGGLPLFDERGQVRSGASGEPGL
jgi:hypothetical protein